jgi:hypothetical protein
VNASSLLFPLVPWLVIFTAVTGAGISMGAESTPPPITEVVIRDRVFYLNGKPFFPLMSWLQAPTNFALVKETGMNTTAGYWGGSGGMKKLGAYVDSVAKAGLYGVMPFNAQLKGNPFVLGYIHGDEPDLPHQISDANIEASPDLHLNPKNPLWKLVDGDLSSWSVLDPMENAWLTVHLLQPVTLESLGVAVTVSKGLALPKEIAFVAEGKELLKTNLAARSGLQKFELPQSVTLQNLTLKITAITPGDQVWGSLGEVAGFDRAGKNVLLNPPRNEPRAWPEKTLEEYKNIKAADPTRPVFMTLTGNFLPFFKQWTEKQYALYPEYIRATDVVGYDIYPIYGWNKPEWIHLGHDATELLVQMTDPRPVYAWIETSKGGQWTGPLEGQKDVTGDHIRAEVWMSICRGATAMGYFTHVWKPAYSQFGVPEANRRALRQINDQITRLTPAILGQPRNSAATIDSTNNVKLDLLARESNGELYLFAVNYDEQMKSTTATIKVRGLASTTPVLVVEEAREIPASDGKFSDTFGPLAVHIYKLSSPRTEKPPKQP